MNNSPAEENHRILIIDDNRAIHDDFRKILSSATATAAALDATEAELFGEPANMAQKIRCEIDSAYQGQEGVLLVQRTLAAGRPYAMAFVDVRMPPGMDGLDTIRKIWEIDPEVQIVLCTAYSDYSWDEMFEKIGNSDGLLILKKPFDSVEALQLVHTLTHKWLLQRQARQKMEDLEGMVAERTSELRQTNQALAHKRDLLQALMDNLPDHIYFKDLDSRFIRINRAHALFLGLQQPEEAIGKCDLDFFPSDASQQKLADEQRLLAAGTPIVGLIEKSDTANGTHWVSSTKVPIYGADGKITGLVGISRDITGYKQAEQERQTMELQLRQSQKLESIGQLAAGIAHEINTPTQYVGDNTRFVKDSFAAIIKVLKSHEELLAAARQNAVTPELLARNEEILAASDLDYLCEQIPSALKQTLEGVERVSKIVRAMKEFSHPGGKEKTAADLNRAIESTVTVANNEWKYVADVKLELAPELPLVPCFVGEFNQCILNLIVNAAHAIGDVVKKNPGTKGLITVQTRRDGDQVEVRVSDTGTGIPEASRPKIFEPFFTTKDVGKGTGQGLSIIYGSIVKRHGGAVKFETEVGRGTTFIIRLPINLPAALAASQPPPLELQAA